MKQTVMAVGALGVGGVAHRAGAAEPPTRNGKPYMKLSLAAYSFNKFLPRRASGEDASKAKMQLDDFVRFCADLNLDACEPTSYYFPETITQDFLIHMKELTFRLGLDISGTAIGNDFCVPPGPDRDKQLADTREWIDHAATMGAPVIRIFAGKVPEGMAEEQALELCIQGIDASLDYAAQRGVFLALENHGGITATVEQMMRIVKGVKTSPWFGVNFDSGNFTSADPYAELAVIAPYAFNAQIKVSMRHQDQRTPADFARIVEILRKAGYRGYLVLEYEEEEDPFVAIPRHIETLRGLLA
ncbi:MAG: sugar phosphate isomerase/epimerase [Candidatus Hydrogenedentes bacterium]|nr:sugar phosphate isomerase/epimerase [Candidatus Hydrogenedentota bacterium]